MTTPLVLIVAVLLQASSFARADRGQDMVSTMAAISASALLSIVTNQAEDGYRREILEAQPDAALFVGAGQEPSAMLLDTIARVRARVGVNATDIEIAEAI